MNIKTWLSALGMVVMAFFLVYLLGQIKALKIEARALKTSLTSAVTNRPAPPAKVISLQTPIDIGDYMTRLQRHANKLYFAGKSENWPLMDFYVEELEETVNEVVRKELTDGKVNVSALMPTLLNRDIMNLEGDVSRKNHEEFDKHYQSLIANCNTCHAAANRSYLVIDNPRTPAFDNQHYEPVKMPATIQASAAQLIAPKGQ